MAAIVIEFRSRRMRSDAKEYVRRLLEYGFESASFWSMERLKKGDEPLFRKYVRDEMRKKGLVIA